MSRQNLSTMNFARMANEHLRSGPVDPLYIDGLAIALPARGIGFACGFFNHMSSMFREHYRTTLRDMRP